MYNIEFLKKENDLNKIIKRQKKEKGTLSILFTSLWDKHSQELVSKLERKYLTEPGGGEMLYIVDSFSMPHSFVIYNTTKLPHLVRLRGNKVDSEDYLSMIEKNLKVT
jgi:hypothetical protein